MKKALTWMPLLIPLSGCVTFGTIYETQRIIRFGPGYQITLDDDGSRAITHAAAVEARHDPVEFEVIRKRLLVERVATLMSEHQYCPRGHVVTEIGKRDRAPNYEILVACK